MNKQSKETPETAFESFRQGVKTIQLATVTADGKPNASYAPFVMDKSGSIYVFLSQLASHTQDLLANPQCSVLMVEDEAKTRQLFARQRISYQCLSEVVTIDEADYDRMLTAMETKIGNVVNLLRSLPDFMLFRLLPYEGRYVQGFGKAYQLGGKGLLNLEHIGPDKI